jgi:hypothetical protein
MNAACCSSTAPKQPSVVRFLITTRMACTHAASVACLSFDQVRNSTPAQVGQASSSLTARHTFDECATLAMGWFAWKKSVHAAEAISGTFFRTGHRRPANVIASTPYPWPLQSGERRCRTCLGVDLPKAKYSLSRSRNCRGRSAGRTCSAERLDRRSLPMGRGAQRSSSLPRYRKSGSDPRREGSDGVIAESRRHYDARARIEKESASRCEASGQDPGKFIHGPLERDAGPAMS